MLMLLQTWRLYEQGCLDEVIDINIGDDLDVEEACRFLKIALLCTQGMMRHRPRMTNVVQMLTGEDRIPVKITRRAIITDFMHLKVDTDQRSSGMRSPLTKSLTTTEPFSSLDTPTQSSSV
jgi:hypothetical protein